LVIIPEVDFSNSDLSRKQIEGFKNGRTKRKRKKDLEFLAVMKLSICNPQKIEKICHAKHIFQSE